ncbi:MAG: flotillin domain-containing protein [Opitutales bacterium]
MTEARAQAEKIRVVAEADQKRFEVEAYGKQTIIEAKNLLSEDIISFELRKLFAQVFPQIVEAMVKPAGSIDSIKVIQTNGFGGGTSGAHASNGQSAGAVGGPSGLPNDLTQALLSYRMQSPLVDKLLDELGLDPGSMDTVTDPLIEALGGKKSGHKPKSAAVSSSGPVTGEATNTSCAQPSAPHTPHGSGA